jgi:LysM repeat protein
LFGPHQKFQREVNALKRKHWSVMIGMVFATLLVVLCLNVAAYAQPNTHTVQKGDTLWDICRYYYGDEELWPKLWQMNPFITNPHLLKPGDVITLLEDVPMKKKPIGKPQPAPPKTTERKFAYGETGIDVSGFTEVKSIGFLSSQKIEPWGRILSGETEKVVLAEGDIIYVSINRDRDIQMGTQFTIYEESRLLAHPLTEDECGYVISFLGRFNIIEEATADTETAMSAEPETTLYKGEIIESYKAAHVGDPILSYDPISPCIEPMPMARELVTNVVAAKYLREIAGQFSVVYLPYGYNDGIRKGNLFEIFEKREVQTPRKTALPDLPQGHLIILEARPDTATGVVIETREEFPIGAFVKGVDWMNAHHVLSLLKECSLQ